MLVKYKYSQTLLLEILIRESWDGGTMVCILKSTLGQSYRKASLGNLEYMRFS